MTEKGRFRKMAMIAGIILCLCMVFISCSMTDWKFSNKAVLSSKRQGMDEKAINRFIQNVRSQPGNPDSHYLLANYYLERGNYQEAIREFNKVLAINPSYVKAYNGRGISFDRIGENDKAVDDYKKALNLDAKLDYVLNNLCYSLTLQGNTADAIQACRQALLLNKNNSRIRNNLGMAYAISGDYDQAYTQFEAASGGDKASAHLKLAVICYERADFQIAADHYRQALLLNPSLDIAKKGLEASQQLMNIANAANHSEENAKTGIKSEIKANDRLMPSGTLAGIDETRQKEMPAKARVEEDMKVCNVKPLKIVGIEVCNGNGKRHMARDVGAYLNTKGFKVVRLTNARNFNYKGGGEIFYENEYGKVAAKIADNIGQIKSLKQIVKMDNSRVNVKVILGRDLIAHIQDYKI